jgi:hypothetical protein
MSRELKNGDEILLLKECESVPPQDEIGFIFVVLIDYSRRLLDENHERKLHELEEELQRSRAKLELNLSNEEHS